MKEGESIHMSNIIITALLTLVATVIAGLLVDKFNKLAPKLSYIVRDGIPIQVEDKNICAYIVTLINPSGKSITDITLTINWILGDLKIGGINISKGLKYQSDIGDKTLEITIPYLNKSDELSITVYAENKYSDPRKPEVVVRSPQKFKLINTGEPKRKTVFFSALVPGIVASLTISLGLFTGFYSNLGITSNLGNAMDQKDVLMTVAGSMDMPDLVVMYANQPDIDYYGQGSLMYAKAKASTDEEIKNKYRQFLISTTEYAPTMTSTSKSEIFYHIGKIDLLLKDETQAKEHFSRSLKLNKDHVLKNLGYDPITEAFFKMNGLF